MAAPEPLFFEFGAREREMLAAPLLPPVRRVFNFLKRTSWLLALFGGYLSVLFFYLEDPKDGHSSTDGFHDHLDLPSHLNMYAPDPNYTALKAVHSASMLPPNHPHSIDALASQLLTANESVAELISFSSKELACALRSHDGSLPSRQTNIIMASTVVQQARRLSILAAARHGSIQQDWFDPTADTYRSALAQAQGAFAAATPSVREKTAYAWRIWPGLFGFLLGDAAAGEMDWEEQAARRNCEAAQWAWDAHQAGRKDVAEQQAALAGFAAEMEGLQGIVVAAGLGGPAARTALKTGYFERVVRPGGGEWDRFEEGWKMLVACGQGKGKGKGKGGDEASAVRQPGETQKRQQMEEQEWEKDGEGQRLEEEQKEEEEGSED